MQFDALKNFDWRSLNSLFSPKAMDDMNLFLEALPQNTGHTLLVISAVVWAGVAGLGLFTVVKMQEFAALSVEKEEAGALVPVVPKIKDTAVAAKDVKEFVDELQKIYKGLEIQGRSSSIGISANSTSQFGQFREAIGHVQNGGVGWRVNVKDFCVGKECAAKPLSATLRINKVSVEQVTSK